jgi:hypothetical protein
MSDGDFFGTHGLSLFSSGSPQKGELNKKTPRAKSLLSIAIHVRFQQFFLKIQDHLLNLSFKLPSCKPMALWINERFSMVPSSL